MLNLLGLETAANDIAFAVGEPFLENLIAAEPVGPDGGGDVAPEGVGVQVNVKGGLAEGAGGIAQGGAFLLRVGPLDGADDSIT